MIEAPQPDSDAGLRNLENTVKRYNHTPGMGRSPGFDPHRDTQWTRNAAAIRHFMDGGEVEILIDGMWRPIRPPETLRFFHLVQARAGSFHASVCAIPIPAKYITRSRSA